MPFIASTGGTLGYGRAARLTGPASGQPYAQINIIATYLRGFMANFRNPSFYNYWCDGSGFFINDGGSDMYDGGNYLSVRIQGSWQFELPYTQDCNGLFPTELDGVDGPATSNVFYSTCKVRNGRLVPHLSRRRRA